MSTDGPSGPAGWQPLGQGTLNERIRHEILRYLQTRKLSPGDRLPAERELASVLKVSRPSVREAVRSLQAEGRLTVRHGQGVFVAEPTSQRTLRESWARLDHTLTELFSMREVLEVPAAQWAAERQDRESLAGVREALGQLNKALDQDPLDFDELQRLDANFHLLIVKASGNRFLEQTQGVLNDLLQTGMRTTLEIPGRLERSRREHQRILKCLLDGDPAAAGRAARSHVQQAHKAAEARLKATATGSQEQHAR